MPQAVFRIGDGDAHAVTTQIPSKRKKGATPKQAGNAPKACTKCATGKTNHFSGMCLVCKNKALYRELASISIHMQITVDAPRADEHLDSYAERCLCVEI